MIGYPCLHCNHDTRKPWNRNEKWAFVHVECAWENAWKNVGLYYATDYFLAQCVVEAFEKLR